MGTVITTDRPLVRLFRRVLDTFGYWPTQARSWTVDTGCGPELETVADDVREIERARLEGFVNRC
jgi:hypothetical protein